MHVTTPQQHHLLQSSPLPVDNPLSLSDLQVGFHASRLPHKDVVSETVHSLDSDLSSSQLPPTYKWMFRRRPISTLYNSWHPPVRLNPVLPHPRELIASRHCSGQSERWQGDYEVALFISCINSKADTRQGLREFRNSCLGVLMRQKGVENVLLGVFFFSWGSTYTKSVSSYMDMLSKE